MTLKVKSLSSQAWTTLPDCSYDGGFTPAIYDIHSDESGRDNTGTMHIDLVSTKRKISCTWKNISASDINSILIATSDIFFNVQYTDMSGSTYEGVFYKGDREAPLYTASDNRQIHSSFTMNFVER